jgi:hypothetical protein
VPSALIASRGWAVQEHQASASSRLLERCLTALCGRTVQHEMVGLQEAVVNKVDPR